MRSKLTIFLLIFLTSCGYSAVYKNTKSNSLMINVISIQGDVEMNNLLRNELELYSNPEAENIFDINLNTAYEKKIISKNSSGKISKYELSTKVEVTVANKEKKETISFIEKFKVENNSDSFEQKNYEDIIKRNFANLIREKLILKLSSFE
jgi:outer membrane lipopolysaccharide assembly protein LptE/RlpB